MYDHRRHVSRGNLKPEIQRNTICLELLPHGLYRQFAYVPLVDQVPQHNRLGWAPPVFAGLAEKLGCLGIAQVEQTCRIQVTAEQFEIVVGLDKDEIGVGQMLGNGLGLVEIGGHHDLLTASPDHEAERRVFGSVGQFDGLDLEFPDLE